jgi:hypothetical protein
MAEPGRIGEWTHSSWPVRWPGLSAGRRPPRLSIPNAVLRIGSRLSPNGGALLGVPPNLREIVSAADGVTYWASSAKAVAELGFMPRSLEVGLRDAFGSD